MTIKTILPFSGDSIIESNKSSPREARNILFKSFEAKAYSHFIQEISNLYYKIIM